jgi:hypothetical protein
MRNFIPSAQFKSTVLVNIKYSKLLPNKSRPGEHVFVAWIGLGVGSITRNMRSLPPWCKSGAPRGRMRLGVWLMPEPTTERIRLNWCYAHLNLKVMFGPRVHTTAHSGCTCCDVNRYLARLILQLNSGCTCCDVMLICIWRDHRAKRGLLSKLWP